MTGNPYPEGKEGAVIKRMGANDEMIDFGRRALLPCFVDAHGDMFFGSLKHHKT